MILSTMNDLPGYEVTEVIGEVFGITVRSRHVGSQIGAGFKSLVGGELKGMTKLLSASRTEAQDRLIEVATAKGADAILAMRFDVNELGGSYGQEICAYGTAVKIRRADLLPVRSAFRRVSAQAGQRAGRSARRQVSAQAGQRAAIAAAGRSAGPARVSRSGPRRQVR